MSAPALVGASWLNYPECGSGETGDCVCPPTIKSAKAFLEGAGFVVVKAKSHRAAQERQRIARIRMEDALERVESIDAWAQSVCVEERRIRDRLTFVYGVARAHGATVEDLRQETSLCDGCDRVLPEVEATPDGRAQLCPSCLFRANLPAFGDVS